MTTEIILGLIGLALIVLGALTLLSSKFLPGILLAAVGLVLVLMYLPIIALFGSIFWGIIWIGGGILALILLYRIFMR